MLKIINTFTTPSEHEKGLMFTEPLIGNQAVLFVFDSDRVSGFWNKNVFFPIDIAFIDKNGYVINIETVKKNQLLTVYSHKPYRYVIETRKDWFIDNNISKGDSMKIQIDTELKKLGFNKQAQYDPTLEYQAPDTTSVYKKIKSIPTPTSIDMLGKEWINRKPPKGVVKLRNVPTEEIG